MIGRDQVEHVPRQRLEHLRNLVMNMWTRSYLSGDRTFEVTLSGTSRGTSWSWTVTHVFDRSLNEEICLPGMGDIHASTEEVAFAHACNCIDKSRPRT